ncbi:MAG TPA: DinB family protein [Candidatus Limnocylindria bacterium]|nr:DinB family protein [Candidatus Limnocylindria bacterium]
MIMDVAEVRAVLARTPSVLRLLVDGLSEPWLDSRPADGEWSAHQVICHLAYVEETDWLVRARMILEVGTGTAFPPVEHGDQSDRYAGLSTDEVLSRFTAEREANLSAMGELDLSIASLERRGLHPTLGEVTLQQLMATWLVHDHNHVAQLQAALASHYVAEVGPWRSFLGILDRVER